MSDFQVLRPESGPALRAVVECAAELGPGTLHLVGGWVRDRLLGRTPVDVDVTVVGDGPAVARSVARTLSCRLVVHETFGTAELVLDDGSRVDVATARRETYPVPGALPEVEASDLADDLARRDFTVNAMAVDAAGGGLVDPHAGVPALHNRRLRSLHDRSFVDDPTRVLRGVELEARLAFRLEAGAEEQVARAIAVGAFDAVSVPRRRQAWDRMVRGGRAVAQKVRRLEDLGALEAWIPGAAWNERLDAALAGLERALEEEPEVTLGAAGLATLAVIAAGARAPETVAAAAGSGGESAAVAAWPVRLAELESALRGASTPHMVEDALAPLEVWQRAALTASADPTVRRRALRYAREWRHLTLAVSGADLVARGCAPGPRIGEALRRVRAARLDGLIGQAEELDFAIGWLARGDGP